VTEPAPAHAAPEPAEPSKAALRGALRAARRTIDPSTLEAAGTAIAARVLDLHELRGAATVTAYVSRGTEPGTRPLLDELTRRGVRVLVPVLLPDMDLDWAEYTDADRLVPSSVPGNGSLFEPDGPRLGPSAVAHVDMVLAPGLAVGPSGYRLGFGGGCYDRALSRVAPSVPVVVLLFDSELLDAVPVEAHDRPVDVAVTPERTVRFARTDGG